MRLAARTGSSAFSCATIRRPASRSQQLRIVAFKEHEVVKDWRVKQMVDTCHVYYANVWSRGDLTAADSLLDPQFVHRDLCSVAGWGAQAAATAAPVPSTGMVVGSRAFKAMVDAVRQQYPDLYVEVEEVAVSDTHRIFVSWVSHGTQLEGPPRAAVAATHGSAHGIGRAAQPLTGAAFHASHAAVATSAAAAAAAAADAAPSYHNSLVRGVDIITFNHDRSKILEVNAFRQISTDERREVERRLVPAPLEIRLARLHWEKPEGGASAGGGGSSSSSSGRKKLL